MFAKLARIDIDNLRQQGFAPTDEEVIKLNDIAVRIENGKETTAVNMPRVAKAGSVVLHEPTIGAMQWWYDYGRDSQFSSKMQMNTYFFMLANARDIEKLSKLTSPKDIQSAVKQWMKGVDATEGELWRALLYVKHADAGIEESNEEVNEEEVMRRLWMTVIASAGALGIVPEQLKTTTQSELVALLIHANLMAGIPMKQSVAKDYIQYKQLLRSIEDRCNKEKEGLNG